jgi:hypothetical protein
MSGHKSVARNQGYTRGAVEHIERHDERKNTNYSNVDVILEQSHNNVHFKVCNGTYLGVFDKMVKDGEISTRGLKLNNVGTKPESSVIAEMMLDVNTEYFESLYESHGYTSGYDFAKAFYAEAYKMAVDEVGDERYVLSATMHTDERNKGLSEQLGRDVYHYHLHVVYIPVVRKEIYYNRSNKNPELAGKLKEVINQVNHSKKWESEKVIGEDGKERLEYSYSKLQDRYHDHMKAAGFNGFERGKVGSTAEHLSVLDYKTKVRQEELAEKEKALTAVEDELTQKSEMLSTADEALAAADKQLAQKENRVEKLTDREKDIQGRIKSIEDSGQMLTLKQLENIETKVHAPLVGKTGVIHSEEDEKNLRKMAMETARANEEAQKYKRIARAAIEAIRDIIQAVGLLKFNFKGDAQPARNLTPEQDILINAIRKHGIEISRSHGYNKQAEEMKKATLGKPMSEIFHGLEKEYQDRNKPSILEAASEKARTHDEQNNNAPSINRERKKHGEAR